MEKEDMANATFKMYGADYGLTFSISCSAQEDSYPNQANLRDAINNFLMALSSWDHVEVSVKTEKTE